MCVAQLLSCWLSFSQGELQSHMVSLGTGFCTWTSVLKLIQSDSSLLDIHLKSRKSASHSNKSLV